MRLSPDLSRQRDKARPIFESLRTEILAGRFAMGDKLPGSRTLALSLGVSRGTVNLAFAMLAAEGLVTISKASAPRVAVNIGRTAQRKKIQTVHLSAWALRLPQEHRQGAPPFFATGILADEYFPERDWLRLARRSLNETPGRLGEHELSAAGYLPLRKAIAAHLKYSRGITADAGNIAIVNGSMQAITLLAQLFLEHSHRAAFEDPGYSGIRAAVMATGAKPVACPLDTEGMIIPKENCRLIFLTPASQFPTGITMTLARRLKILEYAEKYGSYIVEDEYDSEFSRHTNPPQPLKLIDKANRVIYVGSFSRTMFASLRLGYVLLPDALADPFLRARRLYDTYPPALTDQMTMARFMREGYYRLHLRRMNKIYSERHNRLLVLLQEHLGDYFSFVPSSAGLAIFGRWLKGAGEFEKMRGRFENQGVAWQSVGRYYTDRPERAALFGFSHLNDAERNAFAGKVANALRKFLHQGK